MTTEPEAGPITTARAHLAKAITTALADTTALIHTEMPERIAPPCVILAEATPFTTTEANTTSGMTVAFEAVLVAAPAAAHLAVSRLDTLTDTLITRLWADYRPTVTAYTTLTGPDTQPYLAARVSLTVNITI